MTRRRGLAMWPAAAALVGTAVAVFGGAGCNPVSVAALGGESSAAAQGTCPATPEETVGARCTENGLLCAPAYPCGISEGTLSCVCTAGTFQCVDGTGNPIETADAATCPGAPPGVTDAGACPRSEKAASTATCREPGLLCAYPSGCPSAVDQCECFPGTTADGGFGLRFECSPATCASDAALVVFDSSPDSPAEAAYDSGSSGPADAGPDAYVPASGDAGADADSAVDASSERLSDGPIGSDAAAAADSPSE